MSVSFSYQGTTPGADALTYVLFSSFDNVTGAPAGAQPMFPGAYWMKMNGIHRLQVSVRNPQGGTLKVFRLGPPASGTGNRNVSAAQIFDSGLLAATPALGPPNFFDVYIAEYPDIRVDWLNAGVAQTGWNVDFTLNSSPTKVT